jgi:hypothetical protein
LCSIAYTALISTRSWKQKHTSTLQFSLSFWFITSVVTIWVTTLCLVPAPFHRCLKANPLTWFVGVWTHPGSCFLLIKRRIMYSVLLLLNTLLAPPPKTFKRKTSQSTANWLKHRSALLEGSWTHNSLLNELNVELFKRFYWIFLSILINFTSEDHKVMDKDTEFPLNRVSVFWRDFI